MIVQFPLATRALLALLLLAGASLPVHAAAPDAGAADAAPLVLISIDGFKPEYLRRGVTENLNRLAAAGTRAEAMRPSFPTSTFPNHYTLITGMRPDHNGIVGNTMEDPTIPGPRFSPANRDAVTDRRWWDQAEPAWVTAEKQGVRTGILFWPGAEAPIHGVRPGEYLRFDVKVPPEVRVDTLLAWLDKPVAARPRFLSIYFDDVDTAGHDFGPDSAQVNEAAARVDRAVGRLLDGLKARAVVANIVIVSDHGMAPTSSERMIRLDKIAPAASYHLVLGGSFAGINPIDGQDAVLAAALLTPHEHMQCWRKEDIPARLHFGQNPRVPRYLCLADVGWLVDNTPAPGAPPPKHLSGGAHGYDNLAPEMQALFIASGPAFRSGVLLAPFDNVDVYPLLMRLIHVPALPSDGSLVPLLPALVTQ